MKKLKVLFVIMIMMSAVWPTACFADTVTIPYGDSGTIIQGNPQTGGSYSRTDIIYIPNSGMAYEGLYSNGISGNELIDINNTEYKQITTSYGNTGMATVTVTPAYLSGIPTDMDAYQITYLSALQSYGLTVDPITGQIVSVRR